MVEFKRGECVAALAGCGISLRNRAGASNAGLCCSVLICWQIGIFLGLLIAFFQLALFLLFLLLFLG